MCKKLILINLEVTFAESENYYLQTQFDKIRTRIDQFSRT